jgi:hypothetical protein
MVTLALAGMAADGSRFRLVNEVLNAEGKLAAFNKMPLAAEFEQLPSSIRK